MSRKDDSFKIVIKDTIKDDVLSKIIFDPYILDGNYMSSSRWKSATMCKCMAPLRFQAEEEKDVELPGKSLSHVPPKDGNRERCAKNDPFKMSSGGKGERERENRRGSSQMIFAQTAFENHFLTCHQKTENRERCAKMTPLKCPPGGKRGERKPEVVSSNDFRA
ncbi:hypothetical protein CEXT_713861 [Caerostris extrusa]|uniref:Uncharacterized protein n=1 Tax=Caerostris extrusa TaxID=172846 RepID=A0AAV4SA87_CAEEX|nr:hypothetical protein CEXT_713861 [Caerostris extrusa]